MGRRNVDLVGQKVGRLTVLDKNVTRVSTTNHKRIYWNCLCDCGNKVVIDTTSLTSEHSRSCGCLKQESRISSNTKPLEVTIPNRLHNMYLHSAKVRGYSFEITRQFFKDHLYDPCFYCGNNTKPHGYDRVDNNLGYIISNLVTCCSLCNRCKHSLTLDTFLYYLDLVHNQKEKPSDRIKRELQTKKDHEENINMPVRSYNPNQL